MTRKLTAALALTALVVTGAVLYALCPCGSITPWPLCEPCAPVPPPKPPTNPEPRKPFEPTYPETPR